MRFFFLAPKDGVHSANPDRIRTILDTAYASARSLGFQIERASLGLPLKKDDWTQKLITDVLIRAFELLDDMRISHSANEKIIRPNVKQLLDSDPRPPPVRGLPEALTSVFANLCENSVKYRKLGKTIRIEIRFDMKKHYVEVGFRDYGIGILTGEEERIFSRGYRTPRARDHAIRGAGLGLHWCREVLEHFGGGIHAISHKDGLEIVLRLSRKG